MKKILAVAAVALCGLSLNAFAQGGTLSITNPLEISNQSDIVFGNVEKMASKTVTPQTPNSPSEAPGSFRIHGEPNTVIQFVGPTQFPISRTGPGAGAGTVNVTDVRYAKANQNLAVPGSLPSGTGAFSQSTSADGAGDCPSVPAECGDGDGEAYVWYGGTVVTDATTPMGNYSGSANITYSY